MDATQPNIPKTTTVSAIIAGGIAAYSMNWLSLHGIDFKTFNIDSEIIKAFIVSSIIGVLASPKDAVMSVVGGITFIRESAASIWKAARGLQ